MAAAFAHTRVDESSTCQKAFWAFPPLCAVKLLALELYVLYLISSEPMFVLVLPDFFYLPTVYSTGLNQPLGHGKCIFTTFPITNSLVPDVSQSSFPEYILRYISAKKLELI